MKIVEKNDNNVYNNVSASLYLSTILFGNDIK